MKQSRQCRNHFPARTQSSRNTPSLSGIHEQEFAMTSPGLAAVAGRARPWAPLGFSTRACEPKDRLAILHDIYARTIIRADIELTGDGPADFEATLYPLPRVAVASVECSGFRLRRTRAQADPDHVVFTVSLAGGRGGIQGSREATLRNGEAVLSSGDALDVIVQPGSRFLSVTMPYAALVPAIADFDAVLLRRIPPETPALRMLVGYSGVLRDAQRHDGPELGHSLAMHFCDLVTLALGATRDAAEVARGRGVRAARLRAIKADIAANLDGKLSVADIAVRHRMTPRSVQMLFEAEGTTCTEYIRIQRLARAHRMLTDQHRADQKISAIAYDAGFADLSFFNRVFRHRYGAAPSEVRAAAREERAAAA
jgi:AraC-like DNA-binding protein